MYSQFSPPKRVDKPKPVVKENEAEEIAVLSLAPFTPNPKLFFDDVKVGVPATRKLLIKNPTKKDIALFIRTNFPDDLRIAFSWEEILLEKDGEKLLEITWTPDCEIASRFAISLEDDRRMKRDIPVAFKSVAAKSKDTGSKPRTKQTVTYATKKAKSPLRKQGLASKTTSPFSKAKRRSPSVKTKRIFLPEAARTFGVVVDSPKTRRDTYCVNNKENLNTSNQAPFRLHGTDNFLSPTSAFNLPMPPGQEGRYTYTLNAIRQNQLNVSDTVFDDSLEKLSPEISPTQKVRKISPLTSDNRSNQMKTNAGFETQLQSSIFNFSPTGTPIKQLNDTSKCFASFADKINQFDKDNITYNLNISSETYVKGNLSCETYIKDNLSTETYVKPNSSFELTEKQNLSGGTFVKNLSINNVLDSSLSPIVSPIIPKVCVNNQTLNESKLSRLHNLAGDNVKDVIGANLWCKTTSPLKSIEEESFNISAKRESCMRSTLKRKAPVNINDVFYSPPKRPMLNVSEKKSNRSPLNWSKKGGAGIRIAKTTTGLNFNKSQKQPMVCHTDTQTAIITNPFIFAATTMVDPFMCSQVYCNEDWVQKQEKDFMKWLNALLTPPEELDAGVDEKIDVAKVWQEVKTREVDAAPTKEILSNKYLTSNKLNSLRKAAKTLFKSPEMATVLSKVVLAVETGKLVIRTDKDVHLNLSLKSEMMSLLLGYNPLWLRIGLETIYNEIIPLHSNSDVHGLSSFLLERFFKDTHLLKKHKSIHAPKYNAEFKKFFLKKFLVLVYFLDQAKNRKLIPHDPCLFCKKAAIKESREVLLELAKKTLSAVGDITKCLKYAGYIVTHKQTYIHEFNYAVTCLGSDLRDGVRLTKVMEIILMKDGLTSALRVPAISRLQKVHNTKIVFDSLEEAGYSILYDISPKDIVDGHKEKTLSFLWQIIYKFEAPLMVKSATTIQTWFKSLPVVLKRKKLERERLRREEAAKKIQLWYRRQVLSKKLHFFAVELKKYLEYLRRYRAAIKIQSFYRMYKNRSYYLNVRTFVIKIQSYAKGWLIRNCYNHRIRAAIKIQSFVRMLAAKRKFQQMKKATVFIQQIYRSIKLMQKERSYFLQLKTATIVIQNRFRANLKAKLEHKQYLELKQAAIVLQRRYRAKKQMERARIDYININVATRKIQTWYKSILEMRIARNYYLSLKQSVTVVEERYIAKQQMIIAQNNFKRTRSATIFIQRQFRANVSMKQARKEYLKLKSAAITIQRRFRAHKIARQKRHEYLSFKTKIVFIQRLFRANKLRREEHTRYLQVKTSTVTIQRWFRSVILMRKERQQYLALKNVVLRLESCYIAKKVMIEQRQNYQNIKKASIVIQQRYRALILMRCARNEYQQLKTTVIKIQNRFRANIECRIQQKNYKDLKQATILLQQRYRATKLMRTNRNRYLLQRTSAIKIQNWYRSILKMRTCRTAYLALRRSAIIIQIHYLAMKKMRQEREKFIKLKNAALFIQRKFRATVLMKKEHQSYQLMRKAAVTIQQRFRAQKCMQQSVTEYRNLRKSVIVIQQLYKAKLLMRQSRQLYQNLRKATIFVQAKFRANKAMINERSNFIALKNAAIIIQRRFRAQMLMKSERRRYELIRKSTIVIQNRFRLWKLTKIEEENYQQIKRSVIVIQQRFRATLQMKKQREKYLLLRNSVIMIQHRYKALLEMRTERRKFVALKQAAIVIQRRYKAKKSMKLEAARYQTVKKSTCVIQQYFRAHLQMKAERQRYLVLRQQVIIVQSRYRAQLLMKYERREYLRLRTVTIFVQQRFRANMLMKLEKQRFDLIRKSVINVQKNYRMVVARRSFLLIKSACITIQQRFKAYKAMRIQSEQYKNLRKFTIIIQQRFRANRAMKEESCRYQLLKKAAIILQQRFRARLLMIKDRNRYLEIRRATLFIQKFYYGYKVMKCEQQIYKAKRTSIVKLQSYVRGYLVRLKYADYFTPEARERRKIERIRSAAVIKIQAVWRGYRTRSLEKPECRMIRKRAKIANEQAQPQNTLKNRCEQAVQMLIAENASLLQIIKALEDLEFITRRCRDTCVKLSEILPEQMYLMISSTARSLPEMNACTLATMILINFCKYSKTCPKSFVAEYIDNMINVMLNWCDKEMSLFPAICTLLWLFAHNEEWKRVILNVPHVQHRLNKIYGLTMRKEKMVKKTGVKGTSYFAPYTRLPLPSRDPDWGLEYSDHPYVFKNSVHALKNLMNILS